MDLPSTSSVAQADASITLEEFTLLIGVGRVSSILLDAQVDTDTISAMDEDTGALKGGDSDSESFITPPDSALEDDAVQVRVEPTDLYTVIRALGINLYS